MIIMLDVIMIAATDKLPRVWYTWLKFKPIVTTPYFSNLDSCCSIPMFRRSNPHVVHMFAVSTLIV